MSFNSFSSSSPIADLPTDKLDRAMALKSGLIALCEGQGKMNDAVYRLLRREFMNDPLVADLVPRFVRAAQDTGAMWAFLKDHSPQWAPRRQYVRDEFAALMDRLEGVTTPAVAPTVTAPNGSTSADGREKPMYNLFVSGKDEAWQGDPWTIEASRCVNEHTDQAIIDKFGSLDAVSVETVKKLPCIFAYEASVRQNPKFGVIRDVIKRQGQVRVEYELLPVDPFITSENLNEMLFDLDIGKWEMNRTHWAVKEVDLAKELHRRGITLPSWARGNSKAVDISTHHFDVALSFPGEVRPLVEEVARHLDESLGPSACFYDNKYVSQLARPSLDTFLQGLYRNRAKLVVVFLSADYQRKSWCGIEFRAIREILMGRENSRIMFVRTDDGAVEGVFATDGYIDSRRHNAAAIAKFIQERVQLF